MSFETVRVTRLITLAVVCKESGCFNNKEKENVLKRFFKSLIEAIVNITLHHFYIFLFCFGLGFFFLSVFLLISGIVVTCYTLLHK